MEICTQSMTWQLHQYNQQKKPKKNKQKNPREGYEQVNGSKIYTIILLNCTHAYMHVNAHTTKLTHKHRLELIKSLLYTTYFPHIQQKVTQIYKLHHTLQNK